MQHSEAAASQHQQAHRLTGFGDFPEKLDQSFFGDRLVGKRSVQKVQNNNAEAVILRAGWIEVGELASFALGSSGASRSGLYFFKERYEMKFSILFQHKVFLLETAKVCAGLVVDNGRNQHKLRR